MKPARGIWGGIAMIAVAAAAWLGDVNQFLGQAAALVWNIGAILTALFGVWMTIRSFRASAGERGAG